MELFRRKQPEIVRKRSFTVEELNEQYQESFSIQPFVAINHVQQQVKDFNQRARSNLHRITDSFKAQSVPEAIAFLEGPLIHDNFTDHKQRRATARKMNGINLAAADFLRTNSLRVNKLCVLKLIAHSYPDNILIQEYLKFLSDDYKKEPEQSDKKLEFVRNVKIVTAQFVAAETGLPDWPQTFYTDTF